MAGGKPWQVFWHSRPGGRWSLSGNWIKLGVNALVHRVFLLSPANCGGVRAKMVVSPRASFALAQRLRTSDGAQLGDVFSFVSGLYFRGKLAYARRFAAPPDPAEPVSAGGVLVITPNAGLRAADAPVTLETFLTFATTAIDLSNDVYRRPLERGARALLDAVGADCEVVLLGKHRVGKIRRSAAADLPRQAGVSAGVRRSR